jgi:pyruvate/2-oxoglutarate dehydrogenase complex dihydrolipoamide dehydrogenase (E3) component
VDTAADPAAYPGAEHDREWRRLVFPDDYRNPKPRDRYHLAVIGAGPAGLICAIAAAGLGARVALIESTAMGGDCLNVGCVPSKALLEATRDANVDFDTAFRRLRAVRAAIAEHDSVERYTRAGVDVFLGPAVFGRPDRLMVGAQQIAARRIVIATGASAVLPPIPGLAESAPHTNETLFDLTTPPRHLAIIGAGPIGCEIAQGLVRTGVAITLIEAAARVLPTEIPAAGAAVAAALARDGVRLHVGAAVDAVHRERGEFRINVGGLQVAADELLVSAGRRANTAHLNLAAAGVETDRNGLVVVDRFLRTSNRRIYAAGDVCSALKFTHNADAQARIVVQNALFAPTARADRLIVPHCTYTDPEVAQIGATATELEARRIRYDRYRVRFAALDRGRAQNDAESFAEVLTRRGRDRILGATIVGRDAGEQIAGLCIAMRNGLGLGALGRTVLPYPTRAEYLRRLADEYNRSKLKPFTKKLLARWFAWLK